MARPVVAAAKDPLPLGWRQIVRDADLFAGFKPTPMRLSPSKAPDPYLSPSLHRLRSAAQLRAPRNNRL